MIDLHRRWQGAKHRWVLIPGLILLASMGCGEEDELITIPPFSPPTINLVQGATFDLSVALNQAPTTQTFNVDIEIPSDMSSRIVPTPSELEFTPGVGNRTVQFAARTPTGGQVIVTFRLRERPEIFQIWRVSVE